MFMFLCDMNVKWQLELGGGVGWLLAIDDSRTHHYEISGAGRIDYQYHNIYAGGVVGDPHRVVAMMTTNYGSH